MKLEQGRICEHLLDQKAFPAFRHFTGKGLNYNILCKDCAENPEQHLESLREVDKATFEDKRELIRKRLGSPEVLQRPSNVYFEHQRLDGLSFGEAVPLAFHPKGQSWLCCLSTGVILEIDSKSQKQICQIYDYQLKLSDSLVMVLSSDYRFIALANRLGRYGIVWDTLKQRITLRLDRGAYFHPATAFSLAFCDIGGKTYLVHARDWNRLDITEPEYGRIMSYRPSPQAPFTPHYLDYFHGRLYISPDNQWIADDGWIWHPMGVPEVWKLHTWFYENVWESEDGHSKQNLGYRAYAYEFWDTPMIWLDAKTLGIWGFGEDDLWMADALVLYDVTTSEKPRFISGVKRGELIFDTYLFSIGTAGTEVWDITTGERLHHDEDFVPKAYNPLSKEFLSVLPENIIQISHLKEGKTTP